MPLSRQSIETNMLDNSLKVFRLQKKVFHYSSLAPLLS